MESRNVIGIGLVALFAALLVVSVVWVAKPASTAAPTGMSTDGFSSYEEMMAAHHGGGAAQASSEGGCGGVPQPHEGVSATAGAMSEYGITYDNAGYEQLLKAAKDVSLSAEQTSTIVGLDVQIPCCGFTTLQASGNCECGHHVALYGLAKLLASKGYDRAKIQDEINKWKPVFYPEGSSGNTGGC